MGLLFSARQLDDNAADTVWTFQLLHALFAAAQAADARLFIEVRWLWWEPPQND